MTKFFKFSQDVFYLENVKGCFVFNASKDDILLQLSGDYKTTLHSLVGGIDQETLEKNSSLSPEDTKAFIESLTQTGLLENCYASNEIAIKDFVGTNIQIKISSVNDFLPTTSLQEIYASYCASSCACNCCSGCDNCSCSIPPCSS